MNPIDILGGLLGGNSGGKSIGGKILKEILVGGARGGQSDRRTAPPSAPSSPRSPSPQPTSPSGIDFGISELEDLLGVAKSRTNPSTRSPSQPPKSLPPTHPTQTPPFPTSNPSSRITRPSPETQYPSNSPFGTNYPNASPFPTQLPHESSEDRQNALALVMIRAMINAAKADGQISQQEQQAILQQVGDQSPEAIHFLKTEFARPVDVREFAWSVPLGAEQQVYTMSLLTLDLDNDREANYLKDLAHGLRLTPDLCNRIHERHGVPILFG